MAKKEQKASAPVKVSFTKDQLVNSKRYQPFQDFLSGNLDDGRQYSLDEVDALLAQHNLKG